jgi:hypothetical protein
MISKILVAVDSSSHAEKAFEYASYMAKTIMSSASFSSISVIYTCKVYLHLSCKYYYISYSMRDDHCRVGAQILQKSINKGCS